MKIIGIDASSNKTGISLFEDGEYITHTLIDLHMQKNAMKRIPMMVTEICKFIHQHKPDKVIMEESMLASNADTMKKLAYIAGGVMFYSYRNKIEFEFILPAAWRKIVGLQQSNKVKRSILKLESMKAVNVAYGLDVSDDEADAILIGRSGFDLPKINITPDDVDIILADTID